MRYLDLIVSGRGLRDDDPVSYQPHQYCLRESNALTTNLFEWEHLRCKIVYYQRQDRSGSLKLDGS